MALREKLGSLGSFAAAATEKATSKANQAIESGKLSIKITAEEKKIEEFVLNIGDLVLDKLDSGEVYDDEIMALYGSIQASREVIEETRASIAALKQTQDPIPVCASCGAPLGEDDKFCAQCGTKVPEPEIIELEETPPAPEEAPQETEPQAEEEPTEEP